MPLDVTYDQELMSISEVILSQQLPSINLPVSVRTEMKIALTICLINDFEDY